MDNMRLGTNLVFYRTKLFLTQDELFTKTGVSRDTISKIETGKRRRPNGITLAALASGLGVSREDLTGEDVYERPAGYGEVSGSREDHDRSQDLSDERVRQSIVSGLKALHGKDLRMMLMLLGTLVEKRLYQQVADGDQDDEEILRLLHAGVTA